MRMNKLSGGFIVWCLTAVFCLNLCLYADETAKPSVTPEQLCQRMLNNPDLKKHPKGEIFCWHARVGMNRFVDNFTATGEASWIKAGIAYCDFLLDKMDTAPDGYKGWIGPYGYDKNCWCDVHVGDSILLTGILDVAVTIMENASLKKLYADKAETYVEAAKKHFVEKWDKRGTWREDGPYGTYVSYDKYLEPGNFKEWKHGDEITRSELNHPFNKEMDAAQVCLRLYRLTGDQFYRDKAKKIFFFAKSRFQYFDDHYVWNYFEPFGPWDIDLKRKDSRHWVGVHPYRSGYQAGEVGKIVEAYHYGIVFDQQDIQRIINTNLKVMWNGNKENPEFINSNGKGGEKDAKGLAAFRKTYGHSNATTNAGQLWTGLLDFDQTIRDLYEVQLKKGGRRSEQGRFYYENVICKEPPSFKRKYAKGPVTVRHFPFTECSDIYMAAVMPHIITRGKKSVIASKPSQSGQLEIALYSKDGKTKIKTLSNKPARSEVFSIMEWDGTDPDKKQTYAGDYLIRWTLTDGYRQFPVTIKK